MLACSTWGTRRYPAGNLAETGLQQKQIFVRDPVGDGKYVLNPEETAAAIRERFELVTLGLGELRNVRKDERGAVE